MFFGLSLGVSWQKLLHRHTDSSEKNHQRLLEDDYSTQFLDNCYVEPIKWKRRGEYFIKQNVVQMRSWKLKIQIKSNQDYTYWNTVFKLLIKLKLNFSYLNKLLKWLGMVISYLNVALEIFRLSETLLVYYYKCCNLIGYANRYVFVNRYRVAATYCKAEFFVKQQWLFLVFQNNFEEITYVSLFLLKQLDYSLSISIKR